MINKCIPSIYKEPTQYKYYITNVGIDDMLVRLGYNPLHMYVECSYWKFIEEEFNTDEMIYKPLPNPKTNIIKGLGYFLKEDLGKLPRIVIDFDSQLVHILDKDIINTIEFNKRICYVTVSFELMFEKKYTLDDIRKEFRESQKNE